MTSEVSVRVLHIECSVKNIHWISEALSSKGEGCFILEHVRGLEDANSRLTAGEFDAVVADEECFSAQPERLCEWQNKYLPCTPLIILAASENEALAKAMLAAGAADYLQCEKTSPQFLVRTLEFAIERCQLHGELAAARQVQVRLATHDSLTGLPNRSLFRDRLVRVLIHAERHAEKIAVLFIDLDHFKSVNDAFGHDVGDHLLKRVSERLKACVRGSDVLARLGGDEFGCALTGINSLNNAEKVAQQILQSLSQTFELKNRQVTCTPSIGIAMYPTDGTNACLLMKYADAAMYTAKQQGRACLRTFNAEVHAEDIRRLTLESDLCHALELGEFSIHYQPILDPVSGKIAALEALVRWEHPELGMIPPLDFILLAESSGMIIPLGKWVLRTACAQNKAWQESGLHPVRIAVNLSALQFGRDCNLVETVRDVLSETGLASCWLELEITEGATMHNPEATIDILTALRGLGVRIAIDDFGTGYSSLSYLQRFPIDTLKIDRSFVKDVVIDADSAAITNSIVHLAHSLGLETIAEGVEGIEQEAYMRELNCTYMQGYYYSKPVPAEAVAIILRRGKLQHVATVAPPKKAAQHAWEHKILAALKTSDGLPVLSEVGHRLLLLTKNPDANAHELSDIVTSDPALAAQIIRYANAPFFGFQGRIDSIEQAVMTVLGFDGVMGIALGLVAMGSMSSTDKAILSSEGFWWKAVATASLTQSLASQRPLRRRVKPGLAYLSGLLNGIGYLFLVSRFPDAYAELVKYQQTAPDVSNLDAEQTVLGLTHAQIGGQLLHAWQLPKDVVTAVSQQHCGDYTGAAADYVYLLQVADVLLDEADEDEDEAWHTRLGVVAGSLGMDADTVLATWEGVLQGRANLEVLARQLAA